ncbi:MAG: hypothetical protein GY822_26635 [Deltaproteobacteria bacterium]|nr:hypothetical protein [Deltaproteobacteria bacterium]
MTTIKLSCTCGKLRGELLDVKKSKSSYVICHCDDCQTFAHHLGDECILDEWGGTRILQLSPKHIRITEGQEYLSCTRLSPNGLMRWYASCCNCPVANTLVKPKVPFAGIVHSFVDESDESFEEAVGPVRARIQARFAKGSPPNASQKAPVGLLLRTAGVLASGVLRGESRPSPFFVDGNPVVEPEILSRERRVEMHALTGNKDL